MTRKKKMVVGLFIGAMVCVIAVGTVVTLRKSATQENSNSSENIVSIEKDKESEVVAEKNSSVAQSEKTFRQCDDGWTRYKNDAIGITFCHPQWGEAYIGSALSAVTDLDVLAQDGKNSVTIAFRSADVEIVVMDDQYNGEYFPHFGDKGYQDNSDVLRRTGDICQYQVGYSIKNNKDYRKNIAQSCDGMLQTFLSEHGQFFDNNNIGWLYNYDLEVVAYKRLHNGFFDHVLIKNHVADIGQRAQKVTDMTAFFRIVRDEEAESKKASGGALAQTKEDFEKQKTLFATFVESIQAFTPTAADKTQYYAKDVPDGAQRIAQYYKLLTDGNLQEAFALIDNGEMPFDAFAQEYAHVHHVMPYAFRKKDDHVYDFLTEYQKSNLPKETHHVVMSLDGDRLKVLFTEQFMTPKEHFGTMTAFSVIRGKKSLLVLHKDGEEVVVDSGGVYDEEDRDSLFEQRRFNDIVFSPDGRYLAYQVGFYESVLSRLYDIMQQKNVLEKNGTMRFTPDGKYLFMCDSNGRGGSRKGFVFTLTPLREVLSVFGKPIGDERYERNDQYTEITCTYNPDAQAVIFTLTNDEGLEKSEKYDIQR